jgi:hypothetical protein
LTVIVLRKTSRPLSTTLKSEAYFGLSFGWFQRKTVVPKEKEQIDVLPHPHVSRWDVSSSVIFTYDLNPRTFPDPPKR